jgi:hypothetical protein
MNLDKLTVNLRPRNQWEAMDMGVVVARNWFVRLWLVWIASAMPFLLAFIALSLLLTDSAAKWSLLLFWFCKPLYEPPLLHWVSRAVFAEQLTILEATRAIRSRTSVRRLVTVLLTRVSVVRSFLLPVLFLEGLRGKERKERGTVLLHGCETAFYLTIACMCIEIVLSISLLLFCYQFIPEELRSFTFGEAAFSGDLWLVVVAYFLCCSILAPFYVCCGFMLYLSRRVQLEAWDIEIGFKQMNIRQNLKKNGKAAGVLGLLGGVMLLLSGVQIVSTSHAATSPTPLEARQIIAEVLEQKDFGKTETVQQWVAKEQPQDQSTIDLTELFAPLMKLLESVAEKLTAFLSIIIEYLVWICAGVVVALLLLRYARVKSWLTDRFPGRQNKFIPARQIFGMDIRPESLPDNIVVNCRELLDNNHKRQALSLLYRSTLSKLVNNHQLQVDSSRTENECCRMVVDSRPKMEASFFADLTALWLKTAYGHLEPETEFCHSLIDRWQEHYGV